MFRALKGLRSTLQAQSLARCPRPRHRAGSEVGNTVPTFAVLAQWLVIRATDVGTGLDQMLVT